MISASIVTYSPTPLSMASASTSVTRDCLLYLANHALIKTISVIDNSPHQYYRFLSRLSPKIHYIFNEGRNLGFGRAHNLARPATLNVKYHIFVNPDIVFDGQDAIEALFHYMEFHPETGIVQPLILNADDEQIQYLCKRNPTLLAMLVRGFFPKWLKNLFISYNDWYEMKGIAYNEHAVESSYLSGCFLFCRVSILEKIFWFDPSYFMYMEDADITRSAASFSACVHLPTVYVRHVWGRANHSNLYLRMVSIFSYFLYCRKWGFSLY